MQSRHLIKRAFIFLCTTLLTAAVIADDSFDNVEIQTIKAADGIYMLTGKGGNIGLAVGADGVFLIDDQFAPLTEKIQAAITQVSDKPVKFVLNTHWHPDHTGGNENLGSSGAVIVAHDNVRKRLSVDSFIEMFNMQSSAMAPVGLPVITFGDAVTFHLNGDEILVRHVMNAHTDGDAIVHFKHANVIHAGDTYFSGMYPFIDMAHGGSNDGYIKAIDQVLALADEKSVIIPGHGPISNKQELTAWRDMLKIIIDRIRAMVEDDASLEQIQASMPTRAFDEKYGGGFINNETFVNTVAASSTTRRL
jgi:glyoxylase-like metal-dependent hydrolase (beta-lactamase superfamily II)